MPHLFLRLLLALLLVGFTTSAVYVSASSTCTTGCGTSALPWKTIAQGIAGVGTAGGTIIILPGTYTGTGNNNLLVSNSGPVTIQSSTANPADVIINCANTAPGIETTNSGPVTLQGMTFENCFRSNTTSTGSCGGALFITSVITVLQDMVFTGNSAPEGGAICVYSATVTISNTQVHDNYASVSGGGIYLLSTSIAITNSTFINNVANTSGNNVQCAQASVGIDTLTNLGSKKGVHADCHTCAILLSGFNINVCNCTATGSVQGGTNNVAYFSKGNPQVTFYANEGSQANLNQGYVIALQNTVVQELDSNGLTLANWSLPSCGYYLNTTADFHNYRLLFNGATFTFTFTYYATPTAINFGSTSFLSLGDSTLLNLKIDSWPFSSGATSLQLSIPLQPVVGALLNEPTSTALSSTLTEIEYPSSDGTYSVIFTVLNQAIIDGVPTSQGVAFTASAGEFVITLPYFTKTAEWDPDFGVIVQQQQGDGGGSSDVWIIVVAVVIPVACVVVVLFIIVLGGASYYLRRRARVNISRRMERTQTVISDC